MTQVPNDISDAEAAVTLMKAMGATFTDVDEDSFYFVVPKTSILYNNPMLLIKCARVFKEILGRKLLIAKTK